MTSTFEHDLGRIKMKWHMKY